jgi:glycosyltransferase involved in cell wall biosynthesis
MSHPALFFSPEPPYPVIGGGPLRSACILEWLARRFPLDLITFHDPALPNPADALPNLFRRVEVLPLPEHSPKGWARARRNLYRAWRGVPSLVDRFDGFQDAVARFVAGHKYRISVVEHSWCAPYARVLRPVSETLVLDLHNIESLLAARSARRISVKAPLHRVFAAAYRDLETRWLPEFDQILVTSQPDAALAPGARIVPNTLPLRERPAVSKKDRIVFSGNLAYEPNREAVHFFASRVWPILRRRHPHLEWLLAGKNEHAVARISRKPGVLTTGMVADTFPLLAEAQVAVVPILSGSGTRIKILEAWAAGTPVVTTTLGGEGLPGVDGEHWILADEPEAIADAVSGLLQHPARAASLAARARNLYERAFTWAAAWRCLDQILLDSSSSPAPAGVA